MRRVNLTRTGGGFAASVDGRSRQVDAVRTDAHTLSLIVDKVWLHDTVITEAGPASAFVVRVGGVAVTATLGPRRGNPARVGAEASGPLNVLAPMAGRVVRMLVKPGDVVQARQAVAVVEAMKMENEVRAVRGGTVVGTRASEGAVVEAGALLLVIQ